jgi:hypothetical protein
VSYPTVAELRVLEPALEDPGKFSDSFIDARLAVAIADVEEICGRRFVRTRLTETHTPRGGHVVLTEGSVQHGGGPVVSVNITVPSGTATPLTSPWLGAAGEIHSCWPEICKVDVVYTTGLAACPPVVADIIATITRLYATRKNAGVAERVERFALGDTGQPFMLAVPGIRRLGMPEIDAQLQRLSLHTGLAASTGAVVTIERV